MQVHIITIGDEILIGQIVDTNSAWMGQQLNLIGAQISEIRSVGDERKDILTALDHSVKTADVVLITGGLGPTKDDITKKVLADFFATDMVFHQPTYDFIADFFKRWDREPTEAHRQQCYMPAAADLLVNKKGSAPGMWFEKEETVIVSMPGVPYEMKYLMEYEVLPRLRQRFPARPIEHRTILTIGEGESRIAEQIEPFLATMPTNIKIAYLPNFGGVRLRLTGTGTNLAVLNQQLDEQRDKLTTLLGRYVFGQEKDLLEAVIGRQLIKAGKTIATAESCTGGYLAHRITSVAGSSAYFQGSVIAYSNEVKMQQLKVQATTLKAHGAVSEATVQEMVAGTLQLFGTDLAIATSGIAGPDGGTPDKPVGTIWIAIGDKNQTKTLKLSLSHDRAQNIERTALVALNLIRLWEF